MEIKAIDKGTESPKIAKKGLQNGTGKVARDFSKVLVTFYVPEGDLREETKLRRKWSYNRGQ